MIKDKLIVFVSCFIGLLFLAVSASADPLPYPVFTSIYTPEYAINFLLALITTCVIEIPILFGLIRLVFHDKQHSRNDIIFTGFLCNVVSLPYLWFVIPISYPFGIIYGEVFVIIIESIILIKVLKLNPKVAIICSIIMNVTSFIIGTAVLNLYPY